MKRIEIKLKKTGIVESEKAFIFFSDRMDKDGLIIPKSLTKVIQDTGDYLILNFPLWIARKELNDINQREVYKSRLDKLRKAFRVEWFIIK